MSPKSLLTAIGPFACNSERSVVLTKRWIRAVQGSCCQLLLAARKGVESWVLEELPRETSNRDVGDCRLSDRGVLGTFRPRNLSFQQRTNSGSLDFYLHNLSHCHGGHPPPRQSLRMSICECRHLRVLRSGHRNLAESSASPKLKSRQSVSCRRCALIRAKEKLRRVRGSASWNRCLEDEISQPWLGREREYGPRPGRAKLLSLSFRQPLPHICG